MTVTWSALFNATHALVLAEHTNEIFLVGSTARLLRESRGSAIDGRDLDLIVTVDAPVYQAWCQQMLALTTGEADRADVLDPQDGYRAVRLQVALEHLGIQRGSQHYTWLMLQDAEVPIDLYLMPFGWQGGIFDNRDYVPHSDPYFLRNAGEEAICLPSHEPICTWHDETVRAVNGYIPRKEFRLLGSAALDVYGFRFE